MDLKHAFQLLDLDAGASAEAFKKRYHDLAAAWHPDRHAQDDRSQALASERMKAINSAYEAVCAFLNGRMAGTCAACGAAYRKPADVNLDYAACSACGKQLRKPLPRKKRTPCGNDRCAGTLGSSGRCTYCGKTIAEVRRSAPADAGRRNEAPARSALRIERLAVAMAVFGCVLLVLYAYRYELYHLTDGRLAAPGEPSATADRPEPILPRLPSERKPLISRSGAPPMIKDDRYFAALFRNHRLRREDAVKLQQILKTVGYETGKPDGVVTTQTITGLKQYCLDFGYIPGDRFPACFFENSWFHYRVALDHRDWLNIFLTNDLESWIGAQPDALRKQIGQLDLDRPQTVIQLVRRYKFEKFRPLPAPLPETGILRKNFSEAAGRLKITTQTENNDYFIKLVEPATGQEAAAAFIRSGATLSVQLPPGEYELRYAAGRNWYGWEYLFGTSTSYGRWPRPIVLAPKPRPFDAVSIELIPAQHGKLTTDIMSEYDF
jgi:hypothetical protein